MPFKFVGSLSFRERFGLSQRANWILLKIIWSYYMLLLTKDIAYETKIERLHSEYVEIVQILERFFNDDA